MKFEEAYIGAYIQYTGEELDLNTIGEIIEIDTSDDTILVKFSEEQPGKNVIRSSCLHSGGGKDKEYKSVYFGKLAGVWDIENLKIIDIKDIINLEEE